ncbi:MAG: hypothetical protein OXF41_05725 [bacterium]|nr:hypothetical protein [bacterium]
MSSPEPDSCHRGTYWWGRLALPLLGIDANGLRDYHEVVGAVYEGDEATVVPPVVVPGVPLNLNVAVSESWVVSWDPPGRGGEAHWYRLELCFASRQEELFTSDRSVNMAGHVSNHVGENLDLRVRAENINSMHGEWTDTPAYTNITSGVPATLTTTH